jgi:hypothetical protein
MSKTYATLPRLCKSSKVFLHSGHSSAMLKAYRSALQLEGMISSASTIPIY